MKTLVILPAPSDVDTAAGKYNAGLAGEMLSDYLTKYTTDITYKYVAELDKRIYMEYPYILLVGDRPRTWADCPNWCYTYKRGPARVIAVPEHTLALDLRRQAYTEEDEDENEDDDEGDNKDIAPTRIVNYRYWIEVGINKLFRVNPPAVRIPQVCTTVSVDTLKQFLSKANVIFVDIETRRNQEVFSGTVLDCIGIGRDTDDFVLVIPFYNYKGELVCADPVGIIQTLSQFNKTWVLHNATFDLTILTLFCGLRIPQLVEDTMVMHHRIAPEVEKSLGHLIGAFTEQPYHKHELVVPHSPTADEIVWKYNAKDVLGTKLVYYALKKIIAKDVGLEDAVLTGNQAVVDFLEVSCAGLNYDEQGLKKAETELTQEVERMTYVTNLLAGRDFNVGSPKQLTEFFHADHGYKPVAFSRKTKKPKLGKKELQTLAVRTRNPIIPLVIELKKLRKSNSMLKFKAI